MSLALAHALVPNAHTVRFDIERDWHALQILAEWALCFTPLVSIDPIPFGLILDIRGTQRLHGSEDALCQKVMNTLLPRGLDVQLAVAPTIAAAYAFARYSRQSRVVNQQDLHKHLAHIPIEALRIPATTLDALQHVGIYTIQQLSRLSIKQLGLRFGPQLITRLDQLYGRVEERVAQITQPREFKSTQVFEVPLAKHSAIQKIAQRLFEQVVQQLRSEHKQACLFRITMDFIRNDMTRMRSHKDIQLHAASNNAAHLRSVLAPILEALTQRGMLRALEVQALQIAEQPLLQCSLDTHEETRDSNQLSNELLNHLGTRLGQQAIKQVELHPSHIPEKNYSFQPFRKNYVQQLAHDDLRMLRERPPYLLTTPQPLTAIALLPDKPPTRISWNGKSYRILAASGPEKISAEWWVHTEQVPETREYFKLQDDLGRWLWVFRTEQMRWFVQGIWL